MSCNNPLRAIVLGVVDGKKRVRIVPYDSIEVDDKHEVFTVPCGHCAGCRKARSEEWTNRLLMESLYHDQTYFVTLTYDDEHIKWCDYTKPSTGEFFPKELKYQGTLVKKDLQDFHKRLRNEFPNDHYRYYFAGEYGGKTLRPHYHGILFGLHLDESEFFPFGKSETGEPYFVCSRIQNVWSQGFISIEPANVYTFRYVTNYVMKKLGAHPDDYYVNQGLVPPFSVMSRKPGIGAQYLLDHPDIMWNDNIVISTGKGASTFKPPRYFKKSFQALFPDDYEQLSKRHIKASEDRIYALERASDLDYLSQLKVKEESLRNKENLRNKI